RRTGHCAPAPPARRSARSAAARHPSWIHCLVTPRAAERERMEQTPGGPMSYSVDKTEEQWREELGEEQYAVLREAATERAWTGELLDEGRAGLYTCGACDAELFKSGTKFDSGCGWPSFYESIRPDAVQLIDD